MFSNHYELYGNNTIYGIILKSSKLHTENGSISNQNKTLFYYFTL